MRIPDDFWLVTFSQKLKESEKKTPQRRPGVELQPRAGAKEGGGGEVNLPLGSEG